MTKQDAHLTWNPDGTAGFVDERGQPIPDAAPMSLNARQLADLIAGHVATATAADKAALAAERARLQEVAQQAVNLATPVVAKAAAQAGVNAGVSWERERQAATSTVRRKVVRGPDGLIDSVIEVREPATDPPKRRPIGFGRD